MKKSNTKLRKCVVCTLQKDKNDLIRIVRDKEGKISIDNSGKLNGRGAYICKNKECIKKAIETKVLNKHLKSKVDDHIYKELEAM